MMSNFFCFPPKASQNNGSHLKIFPPKPQKISASAARLLGCFPMSAVHLRVCVCVCLFKDSDRSYRTISSCPVSETRTLDPGTPGNQSVSSKERAVHTS